MIAKLLDDLETVQEGAVRAHCGLPLGDSYRVVCTETKQKVGKDGGLETGALTL